MDGLNDVVVSQETAIRVGFFVGVFVVMALLEMLAPRRPLSVAKFPRWASNLGVTGLNAVLLRLVFPAAAVGAAVIAREQGFGLLNQNPLPYGIAVVLAVVAMDLAIYLQHVMVHAVPLFWRFHRMHHADLDFDVTTGARFHPLEVLLSMVIKIAVVVLLGAPAAAVVVFEVLLNATAMFNHSNVHVPRALDRVLRWFVVTPDMHRVHHSVEPDETNSNFGFNLPWWDRLFATYRAQPRAGHESMTIGIRTFREPSACNLLLGMLLMPFRREPREYTIKHRAA